MDDQEEDGPVVDPKTTERIVKPSDFKRLAGLLAALWAAGLAGSRSLITDQLGLDEAPKPSKRTIQHTDRIIGEQIKAIEETTRQRVASYVEQAVADGLSPQALARMIRDDPSGAFGPARASTIARTESAMVYAHGSVAGWRDSERVDKVIIFDGSECGWETHDDPDMANGSVRTLDEYEANPICHPNCVRAAAPWLGDD